MKRVNNKLTASQKFKLKMRKLEQKDAKMAHKSKKIDAKTRISEAKYRAEGRQSTLTGITREAGKSSAQIASSIATNRTAQVVANQDNQSYNNNIDSSLKAYNDAISGNPNASDGSNGTNQGGSTTTMGSSYGSYKG